LVNRVKTEIKSFEDLEVWKACRQHHLITSVDQGYVSEQSFRELKGQVLTSIKLVNGYLRMLHRSKQQGYPV
jgi:hypothetical protein